MTTEQTALQRLKEVCEKATPRKWNATVLGDPFNWGVDAYSSEGDYLCNIIKCSLPEANACFIATARTALPALIELCEAQERLITAKTSKRLKDALGRACLDREYLHALSDLHAAMKAVEVAKARLEEVCPK